MKKYAFIFPGQGSQKIGMGRELCENFRSAKHVFDEVDDALGEHLSTLIFEGPIERLNQTSNTQPALMTVSMAVMRVLEEDFSLDITHMVDVMAGHSLGEYTALSAARTFNVSTAARILRSRGDAMQRAVPQGKGGMVALLGADLGQAEKICKLASEYGRIEIANDNGGGQIVLSGLKEGIDKVPQLAKDEAIKRAVILPVSAPFHSSFMMPAQKEMENVLSSIDMTTPVVPIIANVTAQPEYDVDEIRINLVKQITGQVRWRESVSAMIGRGVNHFVEIGSGKVLSNVIRRMDKEVSTSPVGDVRSIEEFAQLLENGN